jgi:zinc transporter ZupT
VIAIFLFMPSVSDRILFGITQDEFTSNISLDDYDLTSGRIIIWPLVIEKIQDGPLIGFGRVAMWSTGIVVYTALILTEDFGHPHNAYLEWVLDNGLLGFIPVMALFAIILFHALRMFCDRRSGLFMAAGGMAAALLMGLLLAAMGSQTFYPVEGTVGMWCAIGVMLRLSVNRTQAIARIKAATSRPVMAFGHEVPRAPLPASAAAAQMEEYLFPQAEQVEVHWRARRRRPSIPGAAPPRAEPAAPHARSQPQAEAQRPASEPRFVFSSEEVTRR